MRRSSSRDHGDRVGGGISRTTLLKIDDTKLLQELHLAGHSGEEQQTIEHAHPYGFTSVPQGSQPAAQSGKFTPSAEGFTSFMGSNRSHGVTHVVSDRRFRLYKLKDGEVALHDDQGHQVHISRDGVFVSAPQSKKIVGQIMVKDERPKDQEHGQTAQIKEKVHASFQIDKDSFTVTHPKTINLNAPNVNINSGNVQFNKK